MINADLHIHSMMSPDSREDIDSICLKAMELGLKTIAISDHYEFYWPDRHHEVFNPKHVEEEQKIIEKARIRYNRELNILFAIEIGQPHFDYHNSLKLISSFDFDFILASFHKVGGSDLMSHDYMDDEDRKKTLSAYLDGLLVMVSLFDFDSLAHIDLIKRYSLKAGQIERIEDEEERVRKILRVLAMRGKALEINTSLLRDYDEPMPGEKVLSWFREEGGRMITVGSDAHKAEHIAYGFDRIEEMLCRCGFDGYCIYEGRKKKFIGFEQGDLCLN